MKKGYVSPQMQLTVLPAGDVITNSYGGKNGDRYGYDMFDELEI